MTYLNHSLRSESENTHTHTYTYFLSIKPTWCTIFLGMFISFLYTFQMTICPSSGETTVYMLHLVLVILDSHPYKITSTKCHINTVVSPDDGHIVARNVKRKEINILRKTVHKVGFIYRIIQGCTVNKI